MHKPRRQNFEFRPLKIWRPFEFFAYIVSYGTKTWKRPWKRQKATYCVHFSTLARRWALELILVFSRVGNLCNSFFLPFLFLFPLNISATPEATPLKFSLNTHMAQLHLSLNHKWIGPLTPPWGGPKYGANFENYHNFSEGPKCPQILT